jgi:hypothetical protein
MIKFIHISVIKTKIGLLSNETERNFFLKKLAKILLHFFNAPMHVPWAMIYDSHMPKLF